MALCARSLPVTGQRVAALSMARPQTVFTRRFVVMASDKVDVIKSTIQENKVVVYSKTYCPYCTRVKDLFTDLKVPHKVFELDQMSDGDSYQASLQTVTSRRTVPQVFIGGNFIGGCDDTVAIHQAGKLVNIFKEAGVAI